jgi:hypothetical protein
MCIERREGQEGRKRWRNKRERGFKRRRKRRSWRGSKEVGGGGGKEVGGGIKLKEEKRREGEGGRDGGN